MKKQLNIGLFGFGNVGKGLYDLLARVPESNMNIARVCVRNIAKHSAEAPDLPFSTNPLEVLDDPKVNVIVELIDDAEAAYSIVTRALQRRLPTVTGNKKMLARHLPELIALQ